MTDSSRQWEFYQDTYRAFVIFLLQAVLPIFLCLKSCQLI